MISDTKFGVILFNCKWCIFRKLANDCANQKTSSSPAFQHNTTTLARNQTKTKQHSCSMCNKLFSHAGDLKKHVRTHTGEKPYFCSLCSKSFTESRSLKSHMRIHSGENPYICSLCSKSFTTSSHLKSHVRIHTGEKPYSCSQCIKSFRSNNLKHHMRTHTREKPYICSLCSESFTQSSSLISHMRIHTETPTVAPYVTNRSPMGVTLAFIWGVMQERNLPSTHPGEKPYICSLCSLSFNSSSSMKSRKRFQNGKKPHSCNLCN